VRVALVTVGNTNRMTGGYLYHARLLAGLREHGVEVEEIVASGASPAEQEAAAPRLGSLFDPRIFDAIVVDALARVVVAPHLDRWREARPVVAMIHELPSVAAPDPATASRDRGLEEPLLRADRLVAVSDHGRGVLQRRGVPAARIGVVPPGFDRLAPAAGERAPVRDDAPVRTLCVAQWIPRKGILELVRAWTGRERPGTTLELIGETDPDPLYAAAVRAAIASEPSIAVRGVVDDATLRESYAAADLFALPSRYEGYGTVYAEALAFGLPVVACDAGPVPGLVGDEAAVLVPPDDPGALAEALDLLLRDPTLRDRMSAAARRRAEELPRWDDTVTGFLRVLREVAALRPVSRPSRSTR
jgi:glycosyltransferase involved in cell wall biosynthesis